MNKREGGRSKRQEVSEIMNEEGRSKRGRK